MWFPAFPHLVGRLPTVACVSVIRSGFGALTQVPYIVGSFKNQTYEGSSMLVLVYHFQNSEAASVVQAYADGKRVIGVAARGESGDFPSAATFRFGAWRAEKEGADVIARWDLDAWHSPERLAKQVRAMARTARPACVLQRFAPGTADGMEWGSRTLVGEVAWMREHWYPLLPSERPEDLLEGSERHHVAVLDMPELFIFVSPGGVRPSGTKAGGRTRGLAPTRATAPGAPGAPGTPGSK